MGSMRREQSSLRDLWSCTVSVCVCVCVEVSSISRSRSGRLRFPRLQHWQNERVIVPLNPAVCTVLTNGSDDTSTTYVSFIDYVLVTAILQLVLRY